MDRERLDRLLAEYATGGLSDKEKSELFAAALDDQDLFDQLMEEDALREAIELPGARARLSGALRDQPPVASPLPHRWRAWFPWAAALGVIFIAAAITYRFLERPAAIEIAQVRPAAPPAREFPPPPSAPFAAPRVPAIADAPPVIATKPVVPPAPAVAFPEPSANREEKVADAAAGASAAPVSQPAAAPPEAELDLRRNTLSEQKIAAATPGQLAPLWRRTGDGVWTRVPSGDPIGREETIAIRYVPISTQTVALIDDRGRRVLQKSGRAGVEMELEIPRTLLTRTVGDTLALSLVEGSHPMGVIGGVANRTAAPPPPRVRIILRLK